MSQFRTPAMRTIRRTSGAAFGALAVIAALVAPGPAGADTRPSPTTTTPTTAVIPTTTTTSPSASSTTTSTVPTSTPTTTTTTTRPTAAASQPLLPAITSVSAYWVVASDGGVFSFGGAPFYGSTGNIHLNRPVVAMAATSPTDSAGYREVASDGGIFTYGDAHFYGSTGNIALNKPIVGMGATTTGHGYWLVASDGGVFSFGDARFFGSTGNIRLNQPIVGMATTADGGGYWLVASDGGVFAFGDAQFYGSTGNLHLVRPVVGMTPTHDHKGYWMVASDGGIFAFGDAIFHGSLGGVPQSRPIVSMTASASGGGYWFTNDNGAVTAFGDATYWGSTPQVLSRPVVGITQGTGNGAFTGSSYPSGSYGYDISNYQCGNLPPAPHTIGIVEVVGQSFGSVNVCLGQEAAWAGGGLNLYMYLTNGTAGSSADGSCAASYSPTSCNYGFNAAADAFAKARAGVPNAFVAWWVDVETQGAGWSGDTRANAAVVQGALDGLRSEGLNSVGVYASPGLWGSIVGTSYQPAVPYWAADWGIAPQTTCGNVKSLYPGLPSGPTQIVQYASGTYDQDYAC